MKKYTRIFTYGFIAFLLYMVIAFLLKQISNQPAPTNTVFLQFTWDELLIGIVVAIILTFTHIRKQNLKKANQEKEAEQ